MFAEIYDPYCGNDHTKSAAWNEMVERLEAKSTVALLPL
ncbi:hypothetical protein QOZ95_004882 [Paenibacillus brasilensis]|uniref:Uncharacterized protein n=1 Tax=Paenibacillus brasilensis TaxID=128574 RepID=A0ABU0L5X5_9BACL|nr:hypothetical protein [Paenibacillus brasilensis]